MTLYGVSPLAQEEEVDRYCFHECGKILVGGFEVAGGPFMPCRTDVCPYEADRLDLGEAAFDWGPEQVVIRKLREVPK